MINIFNFIILYDVNILENTSENTYYSYNK